MTQGPTICLAGYGGIENMEGHRQMTEGIEQIGNVIGIPAALVVGWCVLKIKDLMARVDILSKENSELKQMLSDIRADVSFIRGKMEKE